MEHEDGEREKGVVVVFAVVVLLVVVICGWGRAGVDPLWTERPFGRERRGKIRDER